MMHIRALNASLRLAYRLQQWLRSAALHVFAAILIASMFAHLYHLTRIREIRSAAGRVQGALLQIESSQRLYVITADPDALVKYKFYRKLLGQRLLILCGLIPPTPRNTHLCSSTNALIAAKLGEMQETIDLVKAGRSAEAVAIVRDGRGVRYTDQIERQLNLIRVEETGGGVTQVACLVP